MEPIPAARCGEAACHEQDGAPDRAQILEAIRGRARDLSATWRAAWRQTWQEPEPEATE
jgi:hypothetical protein